MQTIAPSIPSRKAPKSFYATLYDESSILGKVDGIIYFFNPDTGAITEYAPEMAPWTCILGEAGIADTQKLMDELHGGAARIACTRRLEVA